MTRLMVLRETASGAIRLAITMPRRGPVAGSFGVPRGVETTNIGPRARCFPLSAAANSEGRCRRAAGGKEARLGTGTPALAGFVVRVGLRRPDVCDPWRGAH